MTTYIDKNGWRVEIVEDDFVRFYPEGGGFQHTLPKAEFHAMFKPASDEVTYKVSKVTCEGWDKSFWAFVPPRRWNGWLMPHFDLDTAKQVAIFLNDNGMEVQTSQDGMVWSVYQEGHKSVDGEEDELMDVFERTKITHNGVERDVVPIGAGSWCWELAE